MRWPATKGFRYVGLDPGDGSANYDGERQNGYVPYSQDLYGCRAPLSTKRMMRNVFRRFHPYHSSAPELAGLLDWCPVRGDGVFPGVLPWEAK